MKALKVLRVALALAVFACANLFFFGLAAGAALIFRFQLLPAVLAMNVLAVVVVLAVTLLIGRVYCSVVCPMGVFQDIVIRISRYFNRSRPLWERILPPPPRGVRYVFLTLTVLLVGLGCVSVGALFDGYSLYGRIATQVFKPVYSLLLNALAAAQANVGHPYLIREAVFVRGACALTVAVVGLVGMTALAWRRGRLFCNTLCPVGVVLALASERPLVRIAIDPAACAKCGLCAAACKCGAIDHGNMRVDNASCVRCFNCLSVCRKKAIGLRITERRLERVPPHRVHDVSAGPTG